MGTKTGEEFEAVVVGAGPAGLAVAAALGGRGVSAPVLERSGVLGASWRGRYDRLRLNTARPVSGLPGLRIDPSCGRWVSRDDFVAYLESYAGHHGLRVRCGTAVERIDREAGGWVLRIGGGWLVARSVVVATGFDRVPVLPDWPGREGFAGRLVHASSYRNAKPFRGLDVLVVGLGSTGNEISVGLLEGGAKSVNVAVRTPPNILPREWLGLPMSLVARFVKRLPAAVADRAGFAVQRLAFGDLSLHGLSRSPYGIATTLRMRGHGISVDYGFVEALKRRRLGLVAAVEQFEGGDVVLVDGGRLRPDAVISATGYRPGLEPLVGHLGVLRQDGLPKSPGDMPVGVEGLHFVGYAIPISGQLPEIPASARRVAAAVEKESCGAASIRHARWMGLGRAPRMSGSST